MLQELYRPLYLNAAPILVTARRTAELTKYAANAFLATKITFINEIADLCERVGADVQDVARGIGLDNRIGSKFLHAGPGYGGSCFPKDTLALIKTAQDYDAPVRIVEAVVGVNDNRKRAMGRKIIAAAGGSVRGKTVAVLGLTFKPNTDDMRDSPAIAIIQTLQDAGAHVRAFDPEGVEQARLVLRDVEYASDVYACVDGRRRAGAGDRVGCVSRARFRPGQESHDHAGGGRHAQCLPAGRHGPAGHCVYGRRTAERRMTDPLFEGRLLPGERVVWEGRPATGLRLGPGDGTRVPFSIVWFAVVVYVAAGGGHGASRVTLLFTSPLLLFGIYFLVGRFVVDAWMRTRERYLLTDRRLVIARAPPFARYTALAAERLSEAAITGERNDGSGTIVVGGNADQRRGVARPMLVGIPDVRRVFDLVQSRATTGSR